MEKFITRLLRFRHDIREGMPEDFTILDQQAFLNRAKEPMKALSLFLTLASTIAMTVGGIGLMNTLLVSITERHREIGLRMAIGASPAAILLQYLFESIILCLIGGIAGVILGIVVSKIVSHVTNFPVIIEPLAILSGVITAVLIGIFFGLYPAWTASKLNPVDSLKVGN